MSHLAKIEVYTSVLQEGETQTDGRKRKRNKLEREREREREKDKLTSFKRPKWPIKPNKTLHLKCRLVFENSKSKK